MQYVTDNNIYLDKYTAITIGKFDGFHVGHQKLIQNIKAYTSNNDFSSVVFSFYPHPMQFLQNIDDYKVIFTREEKKEIMGNFGLDVYIEYPFTEDFANMDPVFFVEEILFSRLKCKYLTVGEGYCFGKQKKGTISLLKDLAYKHNVTLEVISDVIYKDSIVSSTLIKSLILSNDFETAKELTIKPYSIKGKIVLGKQIGRTIGFPTANISASKNKLLPKDGVYVTIVTHEENRYKSITNIGNNPTVNGTSKTIETHLIDFDKDIYGDMIEVEFLYKIRDEVKFSSLQELKYQIQKDKQAMINYFL